MGLRTLSVWAFLPLAALSRAVVFTNAPLSGDDAIAWSQFGDASAGAGGDVPAGTSGTTALGRAFTVDTAASAIGGRLYSRDFPTDPTFDPIDQQFTLSAPVAAVGARVVPSFDGFGYHVRMEAFDATGASLGRIDQHYANGGVSVSLGAVSTLSNIARVRYTVATDQPRVTSEFSLSSVALQTQPVPEPASLLVLGLGTAALGKCRRRVRA